MAIDIRQWQLSHRLKPVWFVLKAGFTFAVMYYLLTRDWGQEALQRLSSINVVWTAAAGLVQIGATVLAAARWRWIVHWLAGAQMNTRNCFGWIGVASLIGQVLPSTIGGDAFRVGALATVTGVRDSFRSVLTDRAVGMVGLSLVVVPAGSVLVIQSHFAPASMLPLAMAIGGIGFAVLLITVFPRLSLEYILLRPFQMLARDLLTVLKARTIPIIGISVGIHLLSVVEFVLLAKALHLEAELLWPIVVIIPPALLISTLPVSLGGWGIREGAIVAGFVLLGLDPGVPLLLSLIFGTLGVGVALVGTLVWTVNTLSATKTGAPAESGGTKGGAPHGD